MAISDSVRYLVFPLLVFVAGGLVTGLIAGLTRRRDDHVKALEVKIGLVTEISETVLGFVMAIQFALLDPTGRHRDALNPAYRSWEIETGVLHTKLEAYFTKASIADDWESLERSLEQAYVRCEDLATARANWEATKAAILAQKKALVRRVLEAHAEAIEPGPLAAPLRRLR